MVTVTAKGPTPSVRLFFVRHGETVDNVAQVYAGVTNSALTNHGVQQAAKLGDFLAAQGERFNHIFASDLDRAFLTAEAIRKSQLKYAAPGGSVPTVHKFALLREQNFGSYEGVPFFTVAGTSTSTASERRIHGKDFEEQETYESVAHRADLFLDTQLVPVLTDIQSGQPTIVAVVSHGITLSFLWKRLLKKLPQQSVSVNAEILANGRPVSLEHLGAWSNTGYLQLDMYYDGEPRRLTMNEPPSGGGDQTAGEQSMTLDSKSVLSGWRTMIITINGKMHLQGLKRTKGGIGSSKFDDKQKSINDFFGKSST